MKLLQYITVLFATLCLSTGLAPSAQAGEATPLVKITKLGCMRNSEQCFAYVGQTVGETGQPCHATSIRWNRSDVGGEVTLAMLTSAYMGNRDLRFWLNGCYSGSGGSTFPTFDYKLLQ